VNFVNLYQLYYFQFIFALPLFVSDETFHYFTKNYDCTA